MNYRPPATVPPSKAGLRRAAEVDPAWSRAGRAGAEGEPRSPPQAGRCRQLCQNRGRPNRRQNMRPPPERAASRALSEAAECNDAPRSRDRCGSGQAARSRPDQDMRDEGGVKRFESPAALCLPSPGESRGRLAPEWGVTNDDVPHPISPMGWARHLSLGEDNPAAIPAIILCGPQRRDQAAISS